MLTQRLEQVLDDPERRRAKAGFKAMMEGKEMLLRA
jgi:hypothetical protein